MQEDIVNYKYDIKCEPQELFVLQGLAVDELAFDLAPSDIPGSVLIPVQTGADGNCLPRCGSLFAFKHENGHREIRTRIITELVLNEHLYLSNDYLMRGTSLNKNLLHIYAMFSDLYIPGIQLTDAVIARMYEAEVLKCTKLNAYMGIWQIFALANVLQCPIMSCYPEFINSEVRNCLHRLVFPSHTSKASAIAHILWTSTRLDMTPQNWIPNHFVPLVEIDKSLKTISDENTTAEIDVVGSTAGDLLQESVDEVPEPHDIGEPSKPVAEFVDREHDNITTLVRYPNSCTF
jgi:hypothetical protein